MKTEHYHTKCQEGKIQSVGSYSLWKSASIAYGYIEKFAGKEKVCREED